MVVDEHPDVVGVGDGAVHHARSGPRPVHVDARSAERGVGEVAVVDGRTGSAGHLDTVLPQTGVVLRSVKLIIREKFRKMENLNSVRLGT